MACANHAFNEPNCLACQVKSINKEQRQTAREARYANDLQAQANAEQAAYNEALVEEAAWARVAAEQQAANTRSYEQSMWRQSADGKTWNAWALKAEDWVARASGHDEALLPYWKEAAAPGWNDPALEAERLKWVSMRGC